MKKVLLSLLIGIVIGAGAIFFANKQGFEVGKVNLPSRGHHSAESEVEAFTLGSTISGELTQHSYLNYNDGSRSQIYTIPVEQGQQYKVLVSGPLKASISVLRNRFLISQSGQSSSNQNYCRATASDNMPKERPYYFSADQTGNIDIAINGVDASSYGPFQLSISQVPKAEPNSQSIPLNETLSSTATGKIDAYRFTATEAGMYVFDLKSCNFDSYLKLSGNGVSITNDDGGDDYNARISTWLVPGDYTLEASTAGNIPHEMFGDYTISAHLQALPADAPLAKSGDVLEPGKKVTVVMSKEKSAAPMFHFTLSQRSMVVLTARSDTVDTVLNLTTQGQSWEDDDSGGGIHDTDAQIRETLPAGDYTVTLHGYDSNSGMATLIFNATPR